MKAKHDSATDRLDPRQYDAARAAKRAEIAEKLRAERAVAEAQAFNARLLREAQWQEERMHSEIRRARAKYDALLARGHMHYDGDNRLHCYHAGSPLYDECPKCQAEALAERRAEAQANA